MAIQSGIIVAWPSTAASIPAGWTRETALDARFVRSAGTGANGGGTGGAANHDHPLPSHTHSGGSHSHGSGGATGVGAGANDLVAGGYSSPNTNHTHSPTFSSAANPTSGGASTGTFEALSLDPPHVVVIFIKSDGTPSGLPANCVAYANGAAPTGWTAYATGANRFLKGAAAAGDGGATGGTSDSHTHTGTHTHTSGGSHTHPMSSGPGSTSSNPAGDAGGSHPHSSHGHAMSASGAVDGGALTGASANNAAGDGRPPWKKLLPIQNTSGGPSNPVGVITMWLGTNAAIPAGYSRVTAVDGLFVNGAANTGELLATGGAATHTHTGSGHTHPDTSHSGHTQSAPGAPDTLTVPASFGGGSTAQVYDSHTHTAAGSSPASSGTSGSTTVSATANSSNDPTYTDVIYVEWVNVAPAAPTINSPVGGAAYSTSLTLDAMTTDPESNNWYATFEYDRSDNAWTVIGDGATVASGARSTLAWDISAFTPGINYRVRAKATDTPGSSSGYTTTAAFIIGPGFQSIYGAPNTNFYEAVKT